MTPILYHDGVEYYLINSAHVSKVLIDNEVHEVNGNVLLYARKPTNSGSMWGIDDILIKFNGREIELPNAVWIYGSVKTLQNIDVPCKKYLQNIPSELTLIIFPNCR